jgi:hypothetical protein
MQNRRRSHSLQPINRAPIVDPQSDDNPSVVSTTNLAQVLLLQTTDRHPLSSSSSSSSPAPSLERSPPVSQRTTSRPTCSPPPPPRPPPYTPRHISSRLEHFRIPSRLLNEATDPPHTEQTLQRLLYGLIPDPTNHRPRRSPLRFEPTRTASENIDLLDDVKKLLIQASEIHQNIEVKLTRIQLQLLRQDFERQDGANHFTNLH